MVASPPDFTDERGIAWTWARLRPSGFGTYVLADPEAALTDAVTRDEADAPYFGTVWPSGRVLADQILDGAVPVGGRVCDLGCGVGVAGLAAMCMGAQVTFVDMAAPAFPAVRAAARALALPVPRCVRAQWELDELDEAFDLILAADVLYHEIAVRPVARWTARHLAPGGHVCVADPGRAPAAGFPGVARSVGLRLVRAHDPISDESTKAWIRLSEYTVAVAEHE